jgi:hypothetical protein
MAFRSVRFYRRQEATGESSQPVSAGSLASMLALAAASVDTMAA